MSSEAGIKHLVVESLERHSIASCECALTNICNAPLDQSVVFPSVSLRPVLVSFDYQAIRRAWSRALFLRGIQWRGK